VPVVDKRERLVGIISMADIATQTSKDRELEDALEEISEPASKDSWLSRLTKAFDW
jgi:Mg/Co/Ni transporter MgtE